MYYDTKVLRDRSGKLLYPNNRVYFVHPRKHTLEEGVVLRDVGYLRLILTDENGVEWIVDSKNTIRI